MSSDPHPCSDSSLVDHTQCAIAASFIRENLKTSSNIFLPKSLVDMVMMMHHLGLILLINVIHEKNRRIRLKEARTSFLLSIVLLC